MKAVRIHTFGGPEVLQLEDIARPVPAADEILIKMYASGVNPVDWVVREGGNEALRPYLTLPMTLGWDAAGVVEEVSSAVTGSSIRPRSASCSRPRRTSRPWSSGPPLLDKQAIGGQAEAARR